MTKYELYNKMLESAFEQINSNEEFNKRLLKIIDLLDHTNAKNTTKIKEDIIRFCISAGVIAAINYSDSLNVSDPESDLFTELNKQISGETVNLGYLLMF